MSEIIDSKFDQWFSVKIFHHYFLDDGRKVFRFKPNEKQKELKKYNVNSFLKIIPTPKTELTLKNNGFIFKTTSLGFVILKPKNATLKEELKFSIVPIDPLFTNYTAFTERENGFKIESFEHKINDETIRRRVKYNVFAFQNNNLRGQYLSKPIPKANVAIPFVVEEMFQDGIQLYQRYKLENLNEHKFFITEGNPISALPEYVTQDDIPKIEDEVFNGANVPYKRGIELEEGIPDDVFAIIKIKSENINQLKTVFRIHFKNRTTQWMFYAKNSDSFISIFPPFAPLTMFGGEPPPKKRKATPNDIRVVKQGNTVINIQSEINI